MVPVILPNGLQIEAKLDTGAELCCIYQNIIHGQAREDAQKIDSREMTGLTGKEEFDIYQIVLQIGTRQFDVEVVAGTQERNVIGMNVLNAIISSFDGPAALVDLTL